MIVRKGGSTIKNGNCVNVIGRLLPPSNKIHQNQEVYSINNVICTLKGTDYKNPPFIIVTEKTGLKSLKMGKTKRILQIGNIMESGKRINPNQGRVYDVRGLSPTIGVMGGGGRQPFITVNKMSKLSKSFI